MDARVIGMPHHGMGNPIPKSQWYGLGIYMVWEMPFVFPIGISQLKSIGIPKFSPISQKYFGKFTIFRNTKSIKIDYI